MNGQHIVKVIRIVALHGPLRLPQLSNWYVDGMTPADVEAAAMSLLRTGHIVESGGIIDLRGMDRAQWQSMTIAQQASRADAVEAAVKLALAADELAKKPSAAGLGALLESAKAGLAAIVAAERAKRGE